MNTTTKTPSATAEAHRNFNADDYAYLRAIGWTEAEILARWDQEAGPCRWDAPAAQAKLQAVTRKTGA